MTTRTTRLSVAYSNPLRCFVVPLFAALVPALASAQKSPGIGPGSIHSFPDKPDAVTGTHAAFLLGTSDVVQGSSPLRAFACSMLPLSRSRASVHQYNEFSVTDSSVTGLDSGGVLAAQVSGSLQVNGFLFTMGGAAANASIDLQMLDVTDDPATPLLVWSGPVTSYSSNTLNGFTVGSELGVGLEGGFPYIGGEAEGGIGAEVSIMPDIQVIHDQLDFGFDLMLQRGHTYRLQLAVSVSAHNRVHGGSSIASFFSPDAGGPVVPNVLNVTEGTQLGTENTAFSLLTKSQGGKPAIFRGRVGNYGLTKGDADLECGSVLGFSRTIWEQGLNDPFNKLSSSEADSQQRSDKFLARISGTSSGTAITPSILVGSNFMNIADDVENEIVDDPGVQLTGLTITLGSDVVEAQQCATNRLFEQNLKSNSSLASSYLPKAYGGDLDSVIALVDHLIQQFTAAGLDLNNAPYFQALAHTELDNGNYRLAYARARTAYQLLTHDP